MSLRSDLQKIANDIPPGAHVLDLGCGDGELLAYLAARGVSGYGVEIDVDNVIACVERGVDVIQGDLEAGLAGFADQSFDVVVLSQTIQAMKQTEQILLDMLRVGREAIVTFPNFGHWRHRAQILRGRMPVSESLPYQWFDTPNVRFFTIVDFEALCAKLGIAIRERLAFDVYGHPVADDPNLNGSLAFYRLGRP